MKYTKISDKNLPVIGEPVKVSFVEGSSEKLICTGAYGTAFCFGSVPSEVWVDMEHLIKFDAEKLE